MLIDAIFLNIFMLLMLFITAKAFNYKSKKHFKLNFIQKLAIFLLLVSTPFIGTLICFMCIMQVISDFKDRKEKDINNL